MAPETILVTNLQGKELITGRQAALPTEVYGIHVCFILNNRKTEIRTGEDTNLGVAVVHEVPCGVTFKLDETRIPSIETFRHIASTSRPIKLPVYGSRVRNADVQGLKLRLRVARIHAYVCYITTPPNGNIPLCACAYRNYCEQRHQ